eukprot:12508284-Prorocentrum_lima.AAC.1
MSKCLRSALQTENYVKQHNMPPHQSRSKTWLEQATLNEMPPPKLARDLKRIPQQPWMKTFDHLHYY